MNIAALKHPQLPLLITKSDSLPHPLGYVHTLDFNVNSSRWVALVAYSTRRDGSEAGSAWLSLHSREGRRQWESTRWELRALERPGAASRHE